MHGEFHAGTAQTPPRTSFQGASALSLTSPVAHGSKPRVVLHAAILLPGAVLLHPPLQRFITEAGARCLKCVRNWESVRTRENHECRMYMVCGACSVSSSPGWARAAASAQTHAPIGLSVASGTDRRTPECRGGAPGGTRAGEWQETRKYAGQAFCCIRQREWHATTGISSTTVSGSRRRAKETKCMAGMRE